MRSDKLKHYLLNETFAVESSVADKWVDFVNEHCISLIKDNDYCKSHVFSQVMHGDNEGALSFALQIVFNSEEEMLRYNQLISPKIIQKISSTFAGQFASFKTVMQILNSSD